MEKPLQDQDWERLGKYLAGELGEADQRAFESALENNSVLKQAFEAANNLWQEPPARTGQVDTEAAWQKVKTRISQPEPGRIRPLQRRPWLIGLAASLLILLSLALWQWQAAPSYLQQQTASGETQSLSMADGSQIWLNAASKLEYPKVIKGDSRKVHLSGEAYFEVARQEERPFLVESDLGTVKVLGTRFNVRAYPKSGQLVVSVTEGKVLVFQGKELAADSSNAQILLAGEEAILEVSDSQPQKSKFENPNFLAWKTQQLYLQNLSLAEITELLNRQFAGQQLKVDPAIAQKRFFAEAPFSTESLDEILQSLALSLDLQIERRGDTLLLK